MRYVILDEIGKEELEKTVNEYISIGYEPHGGVSAVYYAVHDQDGAFVKAFFRFYQAMISK